MKRKIPIIVAIVVSMCVCISLLFLIQYNISTAPTITELLDLGEKFLIEQDYEQALLCFTKVIEMEQKNICAYLGGIESYLSMEDHDNARLLLNQAIAATNNLNLQKIHDEITLSDEACYLAICEVYIGENLPELAVSFAERTYKETKLKSLSDIISQLQEEPKDTVSATLYKEIEPVIETESPVIVEMFSYKDRRISNVYDDNKNATEYLKIDNITYVVSNDTSLIADHIHVIKLNENGDYETFPVYTSFPEYYTAEAYDDNADGFFDRIIIKEFSVGVIRLSDSEHLGVEIKDLAGTVVWNKENFVEISMSGIPMSRNEQMPVLYRISQNHNEYDIAVLEKTEIVTGKCWAISRRGGIRDAAYLNIEGTKYSSAYNTVEDYIVNCLDSRQLINRTVSIYAIGNWLLGFVE